MYIVKTITDWWIFSATIVAGVLSAAATFIAVVYTHKKTSEQYEENMKTNEKRYQEELERYQKDKEEQIKKDFMVVIKPNIKTSSVWGILDRLLLFNVWDRVLMLSNPSDGFDFFDNENMNSQNQKFFSIINGSKNEINSLKIDVFSKLITDSSAEVEEHHVNFVKLLRSNEEIIFRVYTTKQREKLWEEINKDKNSKMVFKCTVNYLTLANQQVCYEYEIEIHNISVLKNIDGKEEFTCDSQRVEIKKDEYKVLSEITLDNSETASVFRNLQDRIEGFDRVKYTHRKIGEAQAEGFKIAGYGVFEQRYVSAEGNTIEEGVDKTQV